MVARYAGCVLQCDVKVQREKEEKIVQQYIYLATITGENYPKNSHRVSAPSFPFSSPPYMSLAAFAHFQSIFDETYYCFGCPLPVAGQWQCASEKIELQLQSTTNMCSMIIDIDKAGK